MNQPQLILRLHKRLILQIINIYQRVMMCRIVIVLQEPWIHRVGDQIIIWLSIDVPVLIFDAFDFVK